MFLNLRNINLKISPLFIISLFDSSIVHALSKTITQTVGTDKVSMISVVNLRPLEK